MNREEIYERKEQPLTAEEKQAAKTVIEQLISQVQTRLIEAIEKEWKYHENLDDIMCTANSVFEGFGMSLGEEVKELLLKHFGLEDVQYGPHELVTPKTFGEILENQRSFVESFVTRRNLFISSLKDETK